VGAPQIQQGFGSGEISPELYGQVSLQKAGTAATTLRNAAVNYRGGAMSRGGLAVVGRTKQTPAGTGSPRFLSFRFSITQGYILEFGDNYLRFIFQGGYVVESPITVTGSTKADPCVISVAGTPFTNGDWVFGSGFVGMTELNGQTFIVANATSGSFSLEDLNGNPLDSTAYNAYVSGGTFSRLYTVVTPYLAIDLSFLKTSQSADVMSLTCGNPVTGNEYPQYDLTRLAGADWTLVQSDFDAVIDPPATVAASPNNIAPSTGLNAKFGYQVTAVDSKGNESIASMIATCDGADLEVEGGTNTITWSYVAGAVSYNVYRSPAAVNATNGTGNPIPAGSIYGLVGSAFGNQFLDTSSAPDITQTPPTHQNPFAPGQILAVNITSGGSGLTTVTYSLSTSAGVDFDGFAVVTGNSLGGFVIVNPGQDFAQGDSIAFNGSGFATGAIVFGSTNPMKGDTIGLNGVTYKFVNSVTGVNQVQIQGSLAGTLTALLYTLSNSTNPAITVASYTQDLGNTSLIITYNAAGTGGDAYTLAASRAQPSGTPASGTLTFSTNPTASQTIVLNSATWTFVASGATGDQTNIQATLALTLTQLATDLNASANPDIDVATYSATSPVLTINYENASSAGNSYTLNGGTSGSVASGATLAGAFEGLTGGSGMSGTAPAAILEVGPTSGTYPGVVAYFQERRVFANSFNNPDTFWASQTGLLSNFDASIPVQATDAITASPWTEQVNGIQWLVPMPGGLIAMTGQRAWQIMGEGSYQLNVQPITPATTQAQPQAFNGSDPIVMPVVIDYDILYKSATGNSIRDLSWNFWVNIYTGNDLTILSSHLFLYHQIIQWGWAREPYKILWSVREDGTMLSLTYLKEQEVYGWARHDTLGLAVSVATASEPPVDATYFITQRFPPYAGPAGIYVAERMDDRMWQSVEDAYAVDSAVSNPMVSPNAQLFAVNGSGNSVTFNAVISEFGTLPFSAGSVGQIIRMSGGIAQVTGHVSSSQVTGTWVLKGTNSAMGAPYATSGEWTITPVITTIRAQHLAGMTLAGLADGVPISGLVAAADGTVTLPFPASDVKVGLPFTVQIQTPYLNGTEPTVQGRRKVIPAATFRVSSSGTGFQTGTNQPDGAAQNPPSIDPGWSNLATANTLKPTGGQSPAVTYTSPGGQPVIQLWTGDLRVIGAGAAWDSKGQVAVQQTLPLALEVTAVIVEVLPGDLPEVGYSQQQQGGNTDAQGRQQRISRGPGRWQLAA
jgi:hypothetical protein